MVLNSLIALLCPETFFIVLADSAQLSFVRLRRYAYLFRNLQLPPGVRHNILDRNPGMRRMQVCFPALVVESQYGLGRDRRRRPAARKPHSLAPARPIAVTGTGDVRDSFR